MSEEERAKKREKKAESKEPKQIKPVSKTSPSKSHKDFPKVKNNDAFKAVANSSNLKSCDSTMRSNILKNLFGGAKKWRFE